MYHKNGTLLLADVFEKFRKMCLKMYHLDPEKSNNKYMKDYDKHKESLYLKYWDVNYLNGWAMSQKYPVNKLERIEDTSSFNEDFIKNYNEKNDEGYFIEVGVQYPEKFNELHNDLPFLPERKTLET